MTQLAALLAPLPFKKRVIPQEKLIDTRVLVSEKFCYLVMPKPKRANNVKK